MDIGDLLLGALVGAITDRTLSNKSEKYKKTTEKPAKYVSDKIEGTFRRRKHINLGKQYIKSLPEIEQSMIKQEHKAFKDLAGNDAVIEHIALLGEAVAKFKEKTHESQNEILAFAAKGLQEFIITKTLKKEGMSDSIIKDKVKQAHKQYDEQLTEFIPQEPIFG